jgi:hypothetical protein
VQTDPLVYKVKALYFYQKQNKNKGTQTDKIRSISSREGSNNAQSQRPIT